MMTDNTPAHNVNPVNAVAIAKAALAFMDATNATNLSEVVTNCLLSLYEAGDLEGLAEVREAMAEFVKK